MSKATAFDDMFAEPIQFTDYIYYLSAVGITREMAAVAFSEFLGKAISPERIDQDAVRFGFPSSNLTAWESGVPCWFSGASGKGSKPVWAYDPHKKKQEAVFAQAVAEGKVNG